MADGKVKANGVELWWEDFGDPSKPTILLIVGAIAPALEWTPEFYEPLVDAGYHVVRFDNRDIGLSTWIDYEKAPYDLNDMATDTVSLMRELGIHHAHVIGGSMGGMIAQLVALDYPEHVQSLTPIMSTPGYGDADLPGMTKDVAAAAEAFPTLAKTDLAGALTGIYRTLAASRDLTPPAGGSSRTLREGFAAAEDRPRRHQSAGMAAHRAWTTMPDSGLSAPGNEFLVSL